jgi:hypothetical protein
MEAVMIVASEAHQPPPAPANGQESPHHPLRCGEIVMCPACGRRGETWRWALRRTPRYEAWTVPVYRCGVCRNVFAVKEPGI